MKKQQRLWIGGLAVILFLALWEAAMPLGWVKVADISRPTLVAGAFVELTRTGDIFHHLFVSLQEFFIGFALSVVVGVPLGVALGRYRYPFLLLDPLLMALYSTPRVAMMPLLVVAFGVGFGATVAVEPGFTIGPEDVLGVIVWREADVSGDVTVRPDGMITLPLVRDIRAAGLTPQELATAEASSLAIIVLSRKE